jgi:D-inositol-3-phosphate glycosyltransferase
MGNREPADTMARMRDRVGEPRARIAAISLHTSPLDQPGTGDAGGMNVYVRAVAELLGRRGVAVDVFTRCAGRGVPEVEPIGPLARVIQVNAGPCAPLPKEAIPALLGRFGDHLVSRGEPPYDLVHAHYWLSGGAGLATASAWDVPLVVSFHTLGEVKNRAVGGDDDLEPGWRLAGEREAIRLADRVLAPTPQEAAHLEELYGAAPERTRVVPAGVDAEVFGPRPTDEARRRLGLEGARVALFVGRLQALKGPDVAIRTVAEAARRDPGTTRDLVLLVVGGPSGAQAESFIEELRALARGEGIEDRVRFMSPRPHDELPWVYAAADVLLMPSRTESFGLAALEAQACGVPVIGAAVGGLATVVEHEKSGFLVPGHAPADHAERLLAVLGDPVVARRLSTGARAVAMGFPWENTVDRLLDVYGELVPELVPAAVAQGASSNV